MNKESLLELWKTLRELLLLIGLVLILVGACVKALSVLGNWGNAPQRPLIAKVDSTIYVLALDKYAGVRGKFEWHLRYSVNGNAQVVWFNDPREVLIYVTYLKTLGYVNFGWNKNLAEGIIE